MSHLYLIDDHAIVREGLRAMLEAAGHTVVGESSDPTEAVVELQRLTPAVVLLDLHLAGRSGLEVLAEIQRRALPLRSIVYTMSAQPRHVAEALRLGAGAYVLKGSPSTEVLRAIEAVLRNARHLGAGVAELAADALVQPDEDDPLHGLSPRERQVIVMVAKGQSSAAIGQALHLSPKTVDTYRSRLMSKLGVTDLAGLIRLAVRTGIVDPNDP